MTHVARLVSCFFLSLLTANVHGLKVLGVGAPRTGTQSLAKALRILGLDSVHGAECMAHSSHCRDASFNYLFRGGPLQPVWEQFDAVDAFMDEPFFLMYPEVMERYPKAKFILTEQPTPERWYEAWQHAVHTHYHVHNIFVNSNIVNVTLFEQGQSTHLRGIKAHHRPRSLDGIPELFDVGDVGYGRYFNCDFGFPLQTPQLIKTCQKGYEQHNANVRRMVPPANLLEFNLTDGWEPLCKFLDVPVPSEPFPFEDMMARS